MNSSLVRVTFGLLVGLWAPGDPQASERAGGAIDPHDLRFVAGTSTLDAARAVAYRSADNDGEIAAMSEGAKAATLQSRQNAFNS